MCTSIFRLEISAINSQRTNKGVLDEETLSEPKAVKSNLTYGSQSAPYSLVDAAYVGGLVLHLGWGA